MAPLLEFHELLTNKLKVINSDHFNAKIYQSDPIRLHKSETIREQKRRTLQLESHKTLDVHFTGIEHFHSQLLGERSHFS